MKKYLSLILIALCTLMLFTGCVESDIGVTLNADETGKIAATVGIVEDSYDQLIAMGADVFEGKETSTYEHDGKTYIAYTEVTEYKTFEEIEQALLALTYDTNALETIDNPAVEIDVEDAEDAEPSTGDPAVEIPEPDDSASADSPKIFKSVEISKDGGLFYTIYTFHAVLNPQPATEDTDTGIGIPMDEMFRLTLSIEMPHKISKSNGGTIEDNKVTFEIEDVTEEAEFSVISEQSNIATVLIIVLTLIALLIIFAFCMKRKNNAR